MEMIDLAWRRVLMFLCRVHSSSLQIESVELALNGQGVYLGITDKDKLMGQLEALQTKEAQLQKKELLLLSGGCTEACDVFMAS